MNALEALAAVVANNELAAYPLDWIEPETNYLYAVRFDGSWFTGSIGSAGAFNWVKVTWPVIEVRTLVNGDGVPCRWTTVPVTEIEEPQP